MLLIIEFRDGSGRAPIVSEHVDEDSAIDGLTDYVLCNWDSVMADDPGLSENPIGDYFSEASESFRIV